MQNQDIETYDRRVLDRVRPAFIAIAFVCIMLLVYAILPVAVLVCTVRFESVSPMFRLPLGFSLALLTLFVVAKFGPAILNRIPGVAWLGSDPFDFFHCGTCPVCSAGKLHETSYFDGPNWINCEACGACFELAGSRLQRCVELETATNEGLLNSQDDVAG